MPHEATQAAFLALLPRVQAHAEFACRHVRCAHARADFVAEVVAMCWLWFVRLVRRGKDPARFASALAGYAARAVRSGRKLAGMEWARDALNPICQGRHGFTVGRLPDVATLSPNPLVEALADNTKTPPPEAAAFRLDFPAWLATRTDRDRRVVGDLMAGERTGDVAGRYGLSPARVSQLRREYHGDWLTFCGDRPAVGPSAAAVH
jgi:hypothetical protein